MEVNKHNTEFSRRRASKTRNCAALGGFKVTQNLVVAWKGARFTFIQK